MPAQDLMYKAGHAYQPGGSVYGMRSERWRKGKRKTRRSHNEHAVSRRSFQTSIHRKISTTTRLIWNCLPSCPHSLSQGRPQPAACPHAEDAGFDDLLKCISAITGWREMKAHTSNEDRKQDATLMQGNDCSITHTDMNIHTHSADHCQQ